MKSRWNMMMTSVAGLAFCLVIGSEGRNLFGNQPLRFPGLKPEGDSRLILSGAFDPDLRIGVGLRRMNQNEKSGIVSNPRDPANPPGKRIRIVFKEEISIGVEEGDDNYMFGGDVQVTADEKGCIFVLDWNQKRIQKYDPSGKYLFSIGRKGQGPGEFGNLWAMRFDAKGRIYITDIVNKRISFFDKETGHFQEEIKPGVKTGAVILLSNGNYFSSTNVREDNPAGSVYTISYGIFDRNFKMVTEFRRDRYDYQGLPEASDQARFLAGMMSRIAFRPETVTAVTDEERIIVGFPDRYEFDVYDNSGKQLIKVRKEGESLPVTDRHMDYYFETEVLNFLSKTDPRPKDEDVRKAMVYPKFLPAYRHVIPMDNGFYFVVTDTLPKASTVDLFDPKGVYAGRFVTEAPAATFIFQGGKAYGVDSIGDYRCVKRYAYTVETY